MDLRTRKSRCAKPREKTSGPLLRFVDEARGHNFKPPDLLDDEDDASARTTTRTTVERRIETRARLFRTVPGVPFTGSAGEADNWYPGSCQENSFRERDLADLRPRSFGTVSSVAAEVGHVESGPTMN